ncbi:MAG: Ni/Fe-hydrogenase, b-type cytochrome subunit [Gammaproteobacteria bacterium]|nr:Ni/Fe-hydrogenase, b-type cytochrome subunit [Gammaproteobacteria bacterium]
MGDSKRKKSGTKKTSQAIHAAHAVISDSEYEIVTGIDSKAVFVYQWPVRVWHWINALTIVILCITGYLIASPLPTVSGEASNNYVMGYIRFVHFGAGYIMAIGFIVRGYIAIVGNRHAQEMFTIPVFNKAFWKEVIFMLKNYSFLSNETHRYVGHNPLSRLSMFGFSFLSAFMILTGFAMYGEGTLKGSWANDFVTSWILPLFGNNSFNLHTWHHIGMWATIIFVMIHIYAALREEIFGQQSMVSTMVSGYRFFKH